MGEATDKINTSNWNERETESIASGSAVDYEEDAEQIRAEIEDTRAEMSQTINEIQERLSPEHLMGQVKETVREATIGKVERVMETIGEVTEPAREAMSRAGSTIKDGGREIGNRIWRNPIPLALIGLGVGMLWMRSRRGNGDDYSRTSTPRPRQQNLSGGGQMIGRTRYTGAGSESGTLNQVKEGASNLASRSTEALSNLGTKASETASEVSNRFAQLLRDNPLAVGAVAVAAGTAVGLALPSTRFENEYIGETSEMLVDKAQEVARGAIDKVQDAAKQMTQPENNPQQG
ncbi:MAG TPA: DUF3618 domain-containing protein [Pyrinomonadaceae bacterium]|nr:DUF3618 domain-containing protein [Pyrinomonadaceae bacterium]